MPDVTEWIHASHFYELIALIALTAAVGFIGLMLRQPMIVSFIVVGVLAGPSALGILYNRMNISSCWQSWELRFCCSWSD